MKTKMIEKDIATDLANAYNEGFYAGEKDMEAHYETIVLPKARKETAMEFGNFVKSKLFDLGNIVNESDIDDMLKEFCDEN